VMLPGYSVEQIRGAAAALDWAWRHRHTSQ